MRVLSLALAALLSGAHTASLKAIAEDVRRGRCSPHLGTLQILIASPGPPGARAGLLLGRCWILLGEPDRALYAFSTAVRPGPLAPYAWLWAGKTALRQGDARRGREDLGRVLHATRGPAAVRARLALAEGVAPDPREAERHARAVIRLAKEDAVRARAWASLGRALAAQGRRREAVEAFGWAAWAFPGNPVEQEAQEALRSLAGGGALVPPLARLSRARRLANPQAAEQEIVRALQAGLPPEAEAEAWLRLGIFRLRTRGAAEAFRRAARFPPLAPQAFYWLGVALGGWEAERVWRELVHRYPTSAWAARALLALGLRAEARGELEEALEIFTGLARLHPSSPSADEARWRMGWLRYRQGRFEEAERIFLRSAVRYPGTARAPAHLYWAAKIRARRGMDPKPLLLRVARVYPHTYYGMRARIRLGLPDPPRPASGVAPALPEESFLPVYEELLALGFFEEAEEEAEAALAQGPSRRVLRALAEARLRLGDFPGAVFAAEAAVRGSGAEGDLWRLAYPLAYWDAVRKAAREAGLDPFLVLAVVREESRFDPQAVSPAGAVGLMQLLPMTARELEPAVRFRDLLNPETNLRLGARYLAAQLRAFGDLRLALAAYNAGPSAARKFASGGMGDPDEFVERIPYGETRTYLRRVLESYGIYRWLYP
ncbi:MAG: transglycosylase SLT domain-containing protein [Armatimonadota bacterium]|nr:transglycosylase SLT domain-containing protein [Armatimonadota bacterium]MDR7444423.1 transglycosylase SLT domain-containing protein [Armatimonadota bacterium]MDR7570662.1 transglycosylase SLT domain-containing protein [Armatimonadota bacterium]MDR7615272.1 transglycosylase SLT domain-containing protein [Armatimonadota bacterium]